MVVNELRYVRKHWSLIFDIFMAGLILWVWFFGIKAYCDPLVMCPDVMAYINRTSNIGLSQDIIAEYEKNLTPFDPEMVILRL